MRPVLSFVGSFSHEHKFRKINKTSLSLLFCLISYYRPVVIDPTLVFFLVVSGRYYLFVQTKSSASIDD